jgi:hypothetical protein
MSKRNVEELGGNIHFPHKTTVHLFFTFHAQVRQSHVTTDDQSVSKSRFQGPSGSHDRILISV